MELNNYMRTHIPKKKIVPLPTPKKTFAALYSRFKKQNPEESPSLELTSSVQRKIQTDIKKLNRSGEKSQQSFKFRTPPFKQTLNQSQPIFIQKKGSLFDDLYIKGLQLEKKELAQRNQKLISQMQFMTNQHLQFSELMKQKIRDYQSKFRILIKQKECNMIQKQPEVQIHNKEVPIFFTIGIQTDEEKYISNTTQNEFDQKAIPVSTIPESGVNLQYEKQILEISNINKKLQQQKNSLKNSLEELQKKNQLLVIQKFNSAKDYQSIVVTLQQNIQNLKNEIENINKNYQYQKKEIQQMLETKLIQIDAKSLVIESLTQRIKRTQQQQPNKLTSKVYQEEKIIQTQSFTMTNEMGVQKQQENKQVHFQQQQQSFKSSQIDPNQKLIQKEKQYLKQSLSVCIGTQGLCRQLVDIQIQTESISNQKQKEQLEFIEKLQYNISEQKIKSQSLQKDLKAVLIQKQQIQRTINQYKEMFQELQEQLVSKNQQIQAFRIEVKQLLEQIRSMEELQFQNRKCQLQKQAHFYQPVQQQSTNISQGPNSEIIDKLKDVEQRFQNLLQKHYSLEEQSQSSKKSLLLKIQQLQNECQKYQFQLRSLTKNYDLMVNQMQNLQNSNQKQKHECQQARYKIMEIEEENFNKQKYIQQLGNEISQKDRKINKLQNRECLQCKFLQQQLIVLRKQYNQKARNNQIEDYQQVLREARQRSFTNF